ncbi:MAG: putative tpr repeat protein [Parcubacteria group bacterium Greene0714_36]|nr:MAG: putative tpr repeat protein [Parcubacteria group bacterium Greene0714_36]
MVTDRIAYSSKIILYIIAGAFPLLVLPLPLGTDIGREIALVTLTVITGILWLIGILGHGEVRYPVSPILWVAGILAVVWGASTALGHAPLVSFFFADAAAERLMTLLTGLTLMAVTAGILKNRAEETYTSAGTLLFILIFGGAAAAILSLYTFLIGPIGFLPVQPFFNVIGTVNGLAIFYGALLMMTAGLLLSPAVEKWKTWVRVVATAAAVIFLANLLLIHFRAAWILVVGVSVCLFGLLLIEISKQRNTGIPRAFNWRQWTALGMVLFAIAMIMSPGPIFKTLALPPEVSPSLSATFSTARAIFREGPLRVFFGSGPATFGLDWARYKDPAINQTIFWGVRFNQGQSWVSTAMPTAGILGFVALVGFLAVALFIFLRMILRVPLPKLSEGARHDTNGTMSPGYPAMQHQAMPAPEQPLVMGAFLGLLALILAAFLYPANTSLLLLLFFLAGTLVSLLAIPVPPVRSISEASAGDNEEAREVTAIPDLVSSRETKSDLPAGAASGEGHRTSMSGFWDIRERRLRFETPGMIFASSLAIIFCMALGIAALYGETGRIRAVYAVHRSVTAFGEGKIDDAIRYLEQAVPHEPRNFHTLQLLVQLRTEKVRSLIARAAGGENVQQDFQSAVSLAIQDAQRLIALQPTEPILWRIQGALYEAVIPFIQGSERFAAAAYQRTAELEPLNPAAYVDWGRAGLVFTDRIATLAENAAGKDREDLEKARKENLEQITAIFQRAIQVKQDYAPAHFLLAQTAIRLGNRDPKRGKCKSGGAL